MKYLSKNLLLTSSVLLLSLNLFLSWQSNQNKQLANSELNKAKSELIHQQANTKQLEDQLFYQYQADYTTLPDDLHVKLSDGRIEHIDSLAEKGPWVVLRFSELHCQSCVELELKNLAELTKSWGVNKVLIWGDFMNPNGAHIYKEDHKLTYPLYNIPNPTVPVAMESSSRPYYFILEKDRKIRDIFLPDQLLQHLSHRYLRTISKNFLSQSN